MNPGISLFQGSDSIKLNTSNQKEEEEFLEDEKIRNAELQSLINKAFSDLDEDEDSSISSSHCSHPCDVDLNSTQHSVSGKENYCRENSTISDFSSDQRAQLESNFLQHTDILHHAPFRGNTYEDHKNNQFHSPHKDHCFQVNSFRQNVPSNQLELYKQAELNGMTQLKVMYDVRLREIERLKNDLEAEREEKDLVLRKLKVCEHDKKKLELDLNANESLLAENRNQIVALKNEISDLMESIKAVEKSRDEYANELEIVKEELLHQKQKYIALERSDINVKREKQMDLMLESLNAKHKNEIYFLQQQLDSAIERINRKEDDFMNLEKKLEEMEQKHAANLLNKCDSTMRQEATVKVLLDEANKEKLELSRKINILQQECNMLRNDLEQYEIFSQMKLLGNSSSEEKDTDSFILLSSGWKTESKKKSKDLIQTDVVTKLKDELHRALIGQRAKRKEIRKLQEHLEIKDLQIIKMKEQEKLFLQQTESLKEEMNSIMKQASKTRNMVNEAESNLISSLQADLEKVEKENCRKTEKITDLQTEIEKFKDQLKEIEVSQKKQNQDYFTFHDKEIEKIKKENELLLNDKELEWGREMEKLLTECDEVKQLYIEMKASNDVAVETLKELKSKCEDAYKEKQNLQDQLMRKEEQLKQLQDHILKIKEEKREIEETIKNDFQKEYRCMSEKQEFEIMDLKSKIKDADKEVKRLRSEICLSKQSFLELESTLRTKFETEIVKLTEENEKLKEGLKKKEAEISLRKLCMLQKKNIGTTTDDLIVIETVYEQNLLEINKLEKEISRLRVLEEEKSNEILKLKASYEQKIDEELQEVEKKLTIKYQKELLLSENRVKELSLKYFSEEIEKLQIQHIKDIQSVRDEEGKKTFHLKTIISEKEIEINNLYLKIEDLERLIKTYEEERNKAALIMVQWAKEVESLKKDKEDVFKEIEKLKTFNNDLLITFEDTKTKLRNTRKAALVYKRRLNEMKTGLAEKYKRLLIDIQQKVDDAVAEKEIEIEMKLNEIEKEYKNKEQVLKLEFENRLIS